MCGLDRCRQRWRSVHRHLLISRKTNESAVIQVVERAGFAVLVVKPPGKPKKCTVETNTGVKYEYEPDGRYFRDNMQSMKGHNCSMSVSRFTRKDIGDWKITAYIPQEKNEVKTMQLEKEQNTPKLQKKEGNITLVPHVSKLRLYVITQEEKQIVPTTNINAFRDHYVRVKFFEELDGISGCNIIGPHERKIDLFAKGMPTGVERHGQCGAKILVQDKENGAWHLRAFINDSIVHDRKFHIRVVDTEKEVPTINLQRGVHGTISVNRAARFCELVNPQGVSLPLINGDCKYDIPVVTVNHDGLWTARYALTGKLAPAKVSFNVTTYEKHNLVASVTPLKDGGIRLLCHLDDEYWTNFQFCRFIRPDGEMINVSPGVGIGRYSAYGFLRPDGKSEDDVDCGLTIHLPQAEDYGAWRCEMQESGRRNYTGSILHVKGPTEARAIDKFESRSAVEVKRGDRLKIKCDADEALQYCWMISPNGTMYSVSESSTSNTTLPYEGSGLSLGECGAIVENSAESDNGAWSCRMGLVDGAEIATTVWVTVTDSYVIAERKEIFDDDSPHPTIACRVIDDQTKVVEYCRWVRPDSVGIFMDVGRYATKKFVSRCELTIIGDIDETDIGRWTCAVGLTGIPVVEQVDYIVLRERHNALRLSTIIGIVVGVCVLVTVAACILILHNVRKRRTDKPPAYSPEPCLPTKVDITHYDAAEYKF